MPRYPRTESVIDRNWIYAKHCAGMAFIRKLRRRGVDPETGKVRLQNIV